MTQAPEICQSPDTVSSETRTEEAQAVNVALDPKGLEAALVQATKSYAVVSGNYGGWADHFAEAIQVAIRAYLNASAPALPQDVATLVERLEKGIPEKCVGQSRHGYRIIDSDYEATVALISEAAAALRSQSSTIASAREVIEQLLPAAEKVLEGLHARIDAAEKSAVPVFHGIVDLHDAIGAAREWEGR